MALMVPRVGDVKLLEDLFTTSARENWELGLFKSNITPAETDVASTYTSGEADFTNYARKTLTRSIGSSTWNTPVSQPPSGSPAWSSRTQVGHTQYGSAPQSWTCGASGNTVYGYFIVGATSGTLIMAEAFATPRTLANGDSLSLTPLLETA